MFFLSGLISGIVEGIKSIAKVAVDVVKAIGNVLTTIGKELGILQPEEDVEGLGDRALQAEEAGIEEEDFDTHAEYLKAIREFQIDPEKSQSYSVEEKERRGTEVVASCIQEENPDMAIADYISLAAMNKEYFSPLTMKILGEFLKANNNELITNIKECLAGNVDDAGIYAAVTKALVDVEKQKNPDISDEDALDNVEKIL